MGKFVFAYHDGQMADTPEAQQASMQAWMGWFGELGAAVVDGGNPIGAAKTVNADGSVSDGAGSNPLGGYSIVTADSLDHAATLAKGCPVLANGGRVAVYETFDVM